MFNHMCVSHDQSEVMSGVNLTCNTENAEDAEDASLQQYLSHVPETHCVLEYQVMLFYLFLYMKTDENNNTCLEICVTAQRLNILKFNLTVSIFIFKVLNSTSWYYFQT